MAGGLFALLKDVSILVDDAAAMTKVAAAKAGAVMTIKGTPGIIESTSKATGVVVDDVAVGAKKLQGEDLNKHTEENYKTLASREKWIIGATAAFSLVNKVVISSLLILGSVYYPPLITGILFVGGTFICFEGGQGAKEIWHKFKNKNTQQTTDELESLEDIPLNKDGTINIAKLKQQEKVKIKSASITDVVLSTEIMSIAMAGVAVGTPVIGVAIYMAQMGAIMTAGVYGVVLGIVKIDDLGLWLAKSDNPHIKKTGMWLATKAMPGIGKILPALGAFAMLSVGGAILAHSLSVLGLTSTIHHGLEMVAATAGGAAEFGVAGLVGLCLAPIVSPVWHGIEHGAEIVIKKIKKMNKKLKEDPQGSETSEKTPEPKQEKPQETIKKEPKLYHKHQAKIKPETKLKSTPLSSEESGATSDQLRTQVGNYIKSKEDATTIENTTIEEEQQTKKKTLG